jgi:uncharacterized protein
MQLICFEDAQDFASQARPFLMQNEAAYNLLLGLISQLETGDYPAEAPYMALMMDGERIHGVALRTPPRGVILTQMDDAHPLDLLTADLYKTFGNLPSVNGPKDTAQAFAARWQDVSGQIPQPGIGMKQRIYRLQTVKPPAGVPGAMRRATEDDFETLVTFWLGFTEITPEGQVEPETAEKSMRRFLDSDPDVRGVYVWEHDGAVVSMTVYSGRTPNGMRVSGVYTPPELRGQGYASGLVAGVSQALLDSGLRFCFLYTDLSNPTSNSIYQKIGYEPVMDVDMIMFAV